MTTITELLTEVFNRVKPEHGVMLSRVDFSPASGAVGVAFRGVGCEKLVGPQPDLVPPYQIVLQSRANAYRPEGATHKGSVHGGRYLHWRYDDGTLYWDNLGKWMRLSTVDYGPHAELLVQLTPLNPTSQSAADSDSQSYSLLYRSDLVEMP